MESPAQLISYFWAFGLRRSVRFYTFRFFHFIFSILKQNQTPSQAKPTHLYPTRHLRRPHTKPCSPTAQQGSIWRSTMSPPWGTHRGGRPITVMYQRLLDQSCMGTPGTNPVWKLLELFMVEICWNFWIAFDIVENPRALPRVPRSHNSLSLSLSQSLSLYIYIICLCQTFKQYCPRFS